jgi:hypothetical protein
MKGHEDIIYMRKNGMKPKLVFLIDGPISDKWREPGDTPEVCVYTDVPERADFRFLVGLRVNVEASTEKRAKAFFEAIKAVNPEILACGWYESPRRNWFHFYDSRSNFEHKIEDSWYAA